MDEQRAEVIWKEPPPKKTSRWNRYTDLLQQIAQSPGRWALLVELKSPEAAKTTCYRLRKRWPQYEIVDRGAEVYARLRVLREEE